MSALKSPLEAGGKDPACRHVSVTGKDGILHKLAGTPFNVTSDQIAHVFAGRFVHTRFAHHSLHEFSRGQAIVPAQILMVMGKRLGSNSLTPAVSNG